MQRYYRRSREECFDADGWFHTGDLVRVDADGFFYFLGRRGAMIKTAGANVSPAEVEKAIARVTGGAVAHVVGHARRRARAGRGRGGRPSRRRTRSTKRRCAARLKRNCRRTRCPGGSSRCRRAEVPLLSSGKVDIARG